MIGPDDLRAAVRAGMLSEAQAANLTSLADSRRGARENLGPGDEPFELFRGFNEVFIIMGLLILASGWAGLRAYMMVSEITNLSGHATATGLIGGVILWLFSEYFIRKRRMIGPAIILSALFAANAAASFAASMGQPIMIATGDFSSLPLPFLAATATVALYWLRFRVPFAMALIALGLFATALLTAATTSGTPQALSDIFLLSSGGPFAWITLALGALTFCAAMAFDMSDPHRVTRRASTGFWLHIVAAPMLVNTLALSLLENEARLPLMALLAVFALIAVVIDRRSFLMAAIGYVIALASTIFDTEGAAISVLSLGAVLLFLGAFWERIRARLLRLMAPLLPLHKLPPSI